MNNQLIFDLVALRRLERGWDSYDAKPIDDRAIDQAIIIAGTLPDTIKWSAVPVSDGSVQMESHCLGVDIEIRCSPVNGSESL